MHIIGMVITVEHILTFTFTCSSLCLSSGRSSELRPVGMVTINGHILALFCGKIGEHA